MDGIQNNNPLPQDPELYERLNRANKEAMKRDPLRYGIMPKGLKEYLEAHPGSYYVNENGKIVLDQKQIPSEFLKDIETYPVVVVTNFEGAKSTDLEKPFGMGIKKPVGIDEIIDEVSKGKPVNIGEITKVPSENPADVDKILDVVSKEKPVNIGEITKVPSENPADVDKIIDEVSKGKPVNIGEITDVPSNEKPFGMK